MWQVNIDKNKYDFGASIFIYAHDGRKGKYRNKAVGLNELELLRLKAQFNQIKGRKNFLMLASRSGFTKDVLGISEPDLILIEGA